MTYNVFGMTLNLAQSNQFRSVFRGRPGGIAPQSSIEWIFTGKPGFVGTVLSTRIVLWTSVPNPAAGAYDAPPDPIVNWGGGRPSPIPTPIGAFGASILAPLALSFCGPQ